MARAALNLSGNCQNPSKWFFSTLAPCALFSFPSRWRNEMTLGISPNSTFDLRAAELDLHGRTNLFWLLLNRGFPSVINCPGSDKRKFHPGRGSKKKGGIVLAPRYFFRGIDIPRGWEGETPRRHSWATCGQIWRFGASMEQGIWSHCQVSGSITWSLGLVGAKSAKRGKRGQIWSHVIRQ